MKILIFLMAFVSFCFSQQLNYTWGMNSVGTLYTGAETAYIDTTDDTYTDIMVDLSDYFWGNDIGPAVTTDSANTDYLMNSDRFILGTVYVNFDNQGTASPTTDSLHYTISATPGMYNTASRAVSGCKWGSAVTLETVDQAGDYLAINNVYLHATKYKHFPPEIIRLRIAPIDYAGLDDSTAVNWRFVYPQVIEEYGDRADRTD